MQHVDTFVCLDSEVGLVPHQQLDQLDVTVERCEVQRVEPLLRRRRRVDPVSYLAPDLLFDVVDNVDTELLGTRLAIPMYCHILQVLRQSLLVVEDQNLRDSERVIVSCPME